MVKRAEGQASKEQRLRDMLDAGEGLRSFQVSINGGAQKVVIASTMVNAIDWAITTHKANTVGLAQYVQFLSAEEQTII